MIDQAHGFFGQSSSESREGGMVGCWIIEGESQELFEGDAIINLGFQLGIGIDLEPLLEQKTFHKNYGRIRIIARGAFPDGIVIHDQSIDSGPVDDIVDLIHSGDGPVLFNGREKREIGKGKIGIHFLEAHRSSCAAF
jgi:hypothetical protein